MKRITILLVDDDPDCRTLIRDIIETATSRADVREVGDGQQALDYLRRADGYAQAPRPDLIYLDIEMPGLNGQEVLRRIKADPALRGIPVVMLTGLHEEAQRRQAARNGASGYVAKPAEPRWFLRAVTDSVNQWIRLQRDAAADLQGVPADSQEDPDEP